MNTDNTNGTLQPSTTAAIPTNIVTDNCIIFCLKIRMIGNTKQIKGAKAASKKKGKSVSASKTLLDCPEYEALQSKAGEIRTYLRENQVDGCEALLLQDGAYPIPISRVEAVDTWLQQACKDFNKLARVFIVAYPKRVDEQMNALRQEDMKLNGRTLNVVDPNDYKTLDQVKEGLGIEYRMVSFSTPTKLESLNKELFRRENTKIIDAAKQVAEDTVAALTTSVKDILDHMIERLTPEKDTESGKFKKKTFKDKPINDAKAFFENLQTLNITNNEDLNKWAAQCKRILAGVDPEQLRKSDGVRTLTTKMLTQVKKSVDEKVAVMPKRKVILDDE